MSQTRPELPTPYREVTVSAVVFGVLFGALMNMAITYTGLKIGFTIVGGAIAAVVGFGVLRGVLGKGSILEVNIGQTIATAVNCTNGGIIFTVPVLFLLPGVTLDAGHFWLITVAGVVGATLGVAFIIPLRKQMLDIDRLRFPSGTAVAAILRSPGEGPKKARILLLGVVVAVLIYLPAALPNLKVGGKPLWGYGDLNALLGVDIFTKETVNVGRLLGLPGYLGLVFAITPLSFGAGYLTGRAGLMVLAGGVLAAFVLNPVAYLQGWIPAAIPPDAVPEAARVLFNRPLGIGMLLGGALMGILAALPAIRAAFRSFGSAGRLRHASDELPLKGLLAAVLMGVLLLFVAAEFLEEGKGGGLLAPLNSHLRNAIIAGVGAAWIWFAGIIIAQCTGMTDWSPISGMALLTVVLILVLGGQTAVLPAVLFGAALCVASSEAADMMADLKTGYLVGGQPRRQQLVTLFTAWLGPIIAMATLWLIVETNRRATGIPIGPGTDTVAPQAQALKAVITGAQGQEMPYLLYGLGSALGVMLGLAAFPGLGVLVGLSMYLPIIYVLTYGLGCLANMAIGRIKGKLWAEEWGVPFAAGLIVGEAFLAMLVNSIALFVG